jgi:hypothetical protein
VPSEATSTDGIQPPSRSDALHGGLSTADLRVQGLVVGCSDGCEAGRGATYCPGDG